MPSRTGLGELEQLLLLAIAALGNKATGADVSRELERSANRKVSKGALYTTLERLRKRGLLEWRIAAREAPDTGLPRRQFSVTPEGLGQLRAATHGILALWRAASGVMGETGS